MKPKHTATRLTLARLPSSVEIETIKHLYEGDASGPTVYIQAAQHGREVNGTEVLRRLHDHITSTEVHGRIITVPVADPLTFDLGSYTTPEALDYVNANMNRAWPGDEAGTLHERMAARLWQEVQEADVLIDLHTSRPDTLPHVVYMRDDESSRALAEAFGTSLLLAEPQDEEWYHRQFDSKLRVVATNEGIPSITPELAHRSRIVTEAVEIGVTGILNVLRERGVLDSPLVDNGTPTIAKNHLSNVTASKSGFFLPEPDRTLNEAVEAGDRLGDLYDPATYEVLEEVTTEWDGILYTLGKKPRTMAGETLAQIAVPLKDDSDSA